MKLQIVTEQKREMTQERIGCDVVSKQGEVPVLFVKSQRGSSCHTVASKH